MAWLGEHRGKAQIPPPPTAGRAATKLLRPLAKQFGPGVSVSALTENWAAIVGDKLAAFTRPEKFQGGAQGSTLVVRARGPAAALAEAQSSQILARVAQYTGKAPKKLKIVQGPITEGAAPTKARPSRITKVPRHRDETQSLEETLENWRLAVERREGVALPPTHLTKD